MKNVVKTTRTIACMKLAMIGLAAARAPAADAYNWWANPANGERVALQRIQRDVELAQRQLEKLELSSPELVSVRVEATFRFAQFSGIRQALLRQAADDPAIATLRNRIWALELKIDALHQDYLREPGLIEKLAGERLALLGELRSAEHALLESNDDYLDARDRFVAARSRYDALVAAALECIRTSPEVLAAVQRVQAARGAFLGR